MGKLGDFLVYTLVRAVVGLVARLPLSWAYAICGGLGRLLVALTKRHREIGLTNLRIAFPEQSRAWRLETFRSSYQQLGHLVVEVARLPKLTAEKASRRVSYEPGRGLENYRQAKQMGRGVLFVTAHLSAWELLPAAHALLGHPLTFVVRTLDNPWLERWAQRVRGQFGNRTMSKKNALRGVFKRLQRGEDVGFLLDQNVQKKDAVFAPFFGIAAATSPAVAALAIRTGAPIVAGFIYPAGPPGRYSIRFYPPLLAAPGDTTLSLTTRINSMIEEVVREFPSCWLWGHRRFHAQPDGRNLYAGQSRDAGG